MKTGDLVWTSKHSRKAKALGKVAYLIKGRSYPTRMGPIYTES